MKVSRWQARQLKRDNLEWPAALIAVPFADWPARVTAEGAPQLAVFRSRTHLVQVFAESAGVVRLSINRTDWDERARRFRDDISWDDIQRLKREAGYGGMCAVEIYPPDAEVVNVANMRHVFLLPSPPPFMWRSGR